MGKFEKNVHVDELLALSGRAFIEKVYLVLLGREIDAPGMMYYANRLALGRPKVEILRDIAKSDEAIANIQNVIWLRRRIAQYNLSRRPIIGRIFRAIYKQDGVTPIECQIRRVEYLVSRVQEQIAADVATLGSQITDPVRKPEAPVWLSARERRIHDQLGRRIIANAQRAS